MSNFKDNSGLDVTKPKSSQAERDKQMKEFLEKGGKVQKLKPGYPKNVTRLNLSWTKEEVLSGKTGATSLPNYNSPGKENDVEYKERTDRKIWW